MPKSNPAEKEGTYLLITDRCTDEPLKDDKDDRLGFNYLVSSLSDYIKFFKSRLIIGIYGEWGSGKTTFTNIYLNSLGTENENFKKIEFDAWRFKDDNNLWKSFFLNILNELKEQKNPNGKKIINKKRYDEFSNKLCYSEDKICFDFYSWKFVPVVVFSIIILFMTWIYSKSPQFDVYNAILGILTAAVLLFISLMQIRRSRGPIDSFLEFDEELKQLKDELSGIIDKDFPVVVIVENLDRVEPKYAIELLESIKTLFEFDGFMYFILCDPTILEKQIQEMYKTETLTAETYLQKIITVPFFLPPTDISNFEEFIKSLLKNNSSNETLIKYLKISGIKNPRKIKKILIEMEMTCRFMQSLANTTNNELDIKIPFILKLIILKYEYSYIFQLIRMYVENKNNKLEEAIKFILSETPASGDYYALVTRTILQELLNFNPRDTMMSDRDTYRENIKEAIEKIRRGLDFISLTKDSVYDISNLSELSSYLLSVAITGKGYTEKRKYEDTNYIEPLNKLVRDYDTNPQIQALYPNANTWINKGDLVFNQGKYEEAIACYDKAIEIDPNNAIAWSNKGLALHALGRDTEAQECFDKARK